MKARMAEDVARFAQWAPAALQQRIAWRESVIRQTQHVVAAMRKAQRVQRQAKAVEAEVVG